jgi:pimeloyl-ACP methyl ester carboxylesterase
MEYMKEPGKSSRTVVFIHGLFVNPESWQGWKNYFASRGFTCHTPANPFHEGEPRELREHIDPRLGSVNFEELVNHISRFISGLPEEPILIGHSLAGLVVQKLISLGKGVAGICIDGAAPRGIISLKWSFWKSNFPVINYLKGDSVFKPTKKWFQYAFCNTLAREESDRVFEEIVVPESRNIPRGTLKGFGSIDLRRPHPPLLFIAGEKDHIVPASLNLKNFRAYRDPVSVREFREFKGRGHYICGERNWEEVADYTIGWIGRIQAGPAASGPGPGG